MFEVFYDNEIQEAELFDGEDFITFNLVAMDLDRNIVTMAITKCGKIVIDDYELYQNDDTYSIYYEILGRIFEITIANKIKEKDNEN